MKTFKLVSDFEPTGDQPEAIDKLVQGVKKGYKDQVLLGVTGSGKTFTLANMVESLQLPTLVISHNKTLAGQLYQEFRDFFGENAVSYFVSYYDYYQPEAYIPQTDTYIEKETDINEEIDKLRLQATANLLTRKDTLIVASVSCIYNIGSPREYGNYVIELSEGAKISQDNLLENLVDLQYNRAGYDFTRGTFRIRGENIDIFPAYSDTALRIKLTDKKVKTIYEIDPITGKMRDKLDDVLIYPAKHYIIDTDRQKKAFAQIREDMERKVEQYKKQNKYVEAQRLMQKVNYDLEMMEEIGYVNGIENYSRYFDGRSPGEPPYTLLDYYKYKYADDWLLFIDESHMTVPQIRGMYRGDAARKQTLIDFGFRLPAALDNRPLRFDEFMRRRPSTVYVSATPADWERDRSEQVVQQLIRPTGLVDPKIDVRPSKGQIPDLVKEIFIRKQRGERVLVTTLTKRMAEELTSYLNNPEELKRLSMKTPGVARSGSPGVDTSDKTQGDSLCETPCVPKVQYLHSEVDTLDRQDILDDLREGKYDVVVGINLLREGLDLPEVSLVAILDADKEGFLRSETSLIQTMGRAARNIRGQVIMYSDEITGSMRRAIDEVERRRKVQQKYNETHGVSPKTIRKPIRQKLVERSHENTKTKKHKNSVMYNGQSIDEIDFNQLVPKERKEFLKKLEREMRKAARELDFEKAAYFRDKADEVRDL